MAYVSPLSSLIMQKTIIPHNENWINEAHEFDGIDTLFIFGGMVVGFLQAGFTGALVALAVFVIQHAIRTTPLLLKGLESYQRLRAGDETIIDAVLEDTMPILKRSVPSVSFASDASNKGEGVKTLPVDVPTPSPSPLVRPSRPSDGVHIWLSDVEKTL